MSATNRTPIAPGRKKSRPRRKERHLRLRVRVDETAPPVDLARVRAFVIRMGIEEWRRQRSALAAQPDRKAEHDVAPAA